jgi:hypothetical protein
MNEAAKTMANNCKKKGLLYSRVILRKLSLWSNDWLEYHNFKLRLSPRTVGIIIALICLLFLANHFWPNKSAAALNAAIVASAPPADSTSMTKSEWRSKYNGLYAKFKNIFYPKDGVYAALGHTFRTQTIGGMNQYWYWRCKDGIIQAEVQPDFPNQPPNCVYFLRVNDY